MCYYGNAEQRGDIMKDYDRISLLGENVLLFRQSLGWSAAELGERVGVTRQAINNIEKDPAKLSKTLYLAIRCVFAEEISSKPRETEMLQVLLASLVDHPEKLEDDERKKLVEKTKMITPSIMTKASTREKISNEWFEMTKGSFLRLLGFITAGIGAAMILDALEESSNMLGWVSVISDAGSHKRPKRK